MKVKLLCADAARYTAIRGQVAPQLENAEIIPVYGPVPLALGAMDGALPDLLIIDGPTTGTLEAIESLALRHPGIDAIVITADASPEFLMRAMRSGVREVVLTSEPPAALLAAVTRALKKRGVSVPSGAAGKVLTFLPCKGGSGATFLAANIAYVLASEQNLRVALIDLNLQFGDAALYLSEKRAPSDIGELSVNIARLDLSLLESAMLSVDTRLSILAAPEDPARAADVRPEHVEAIIRLAQRHYDVVVVDVGRSLDAVSLRALDLANLILPVLQLTLTSVRDARRMFDVFSSLGYAHGKVRFIVNRFEKGGEISLDTAAKALGDVICDTVPNSYAAVIASINLGNPILKQQRNNPVSRALVELARDLIPSAQQVAAGGGWLTRVFGAR